MSLASTATSISDELYLVTEFRRGKPRAFEIIFNKHYGALCYFAYEFVDDRDASEDIVSDVFIKLWTMRDNFHHLRAIKAFLYVSVRNACLNYLRRDKMMEHHKNNLVPDLLLEEQNDYVMTRIFEVEVIREIYESIEELPPQCKRVLRMTLQGMTTEDIALTMGLSKQTVRNTRVRATEMLRKRLMENAAAFGAATIILGAAIY